MAEKPASGIELLGQIEAKIEPVLNSSKMGLECGWAWIELFEDPENNGL